MCLTVDMVNWQQQSMVSLSVESAKNDTVSGISPNITQVTQGTPLVVSGLVGTALTRIAFVAEGAADCCTFACANPSPLFPVLTVSLAQREA